MVHTIQVAYIPPKRHMDLVLQGDFGFALAHLCNDSSYVDFFKKYKGYKILDNGVAEGCRVDSGYLVDMAKAIGANTLICLDEVMNREETFYLTRDTINVMSQREIKEIKLMAVPHGRNTREYVNSAQELSRLPEVSILGISKFDAERVWHGSNISLGRFWAVNEMIANGVTKDMHLLGRGDPKELFYHISKGNTCVKTSDSSVEVLNAIAGIQPNTKVERASNRHDYFDMFLDQMTISKVIEQFEITKRYARGVGIGK